MWFALPFGAGCGLCCYALPEGLRLWGVGAALAMVAVSFPLREKPRKMLRIAALGCAAGILWFTGYSALFLHPAEAMTGGKFILEMELTSYPEEATGGARCQVRVAGLRGEAVYYGGGDLLGLEPGNHVLAQVTAYSAKDLAGEESHYYVSHGTFLRLYGSGEALAVTPGGAGSWRYAVL